MQSNTKKMQHCFNTHVIFYGCLAKVHNLKTRLRQAIALEFDAGKKIKVEQYHVKAHLATSLSKEYIGRLKYSRARLRAQI